MHSLLQMGQQLGLGPPTRDWCCKKKHSWVAILQRQDSNMPEQSALSLIVQEWKKKIKSVAAADFAGKAAGGAASKRLWWKIAKPRPRLCRDRQTKSTSLASTGRSPFLPLNKNSMSVFCRSCSQCFPFLLGGTFPQRLGLYLVGLVYLYRGAVLKNAIFEILSHFEIVQFDINMKTVQNCMLSSYA